VIQKTFCLGTVIAILVLSACGPSQRRTYQSDNAFARCFDRDYNPEISLVQKKNCWSDWLMGRQYNQPDDKTKYAKLRLAEIAEGISMPGPPGPPGSFNERPSPPPQTSAPQSNAQVTEKESATSSPAPTSAHCEEGCRVSFQSCSQECPGETVDAGAINPCKNACDKGYRSCMKTCFK